MKKGRFSEAQLVAILQQRASGQTVARIVREHGLSEATFYAWKSKYAGASVAELTRLKHLKEENRKLKQMFADLSLENQAIKEILRNSFRRELLDAHLFRSLAHVRQLVDEWMLDYNTQRPHQALNFMTPIEFKQAA